MGVARRGTQQAIVVNGTEVASLAVSFPAAATDGDLVVAGVADWKGTRSAPTTYPTGISDNQANSYNQDETGVAVNGSTRAGLYSTNDAASNGGTFTITYTPPETRVITMIISEYSAVTLSNALDVHAKGGSATPSTTETTEVAGPTNNPDAVAVAMLTNDLGGDATAPAPTTPFDAIAGNGNGATSVVAAMADRILTAIGTQQCAWTTTNESWDACIAVYMAPPIQVDAFQMGGQLARRYPWDVQV